MTHKKIKTSESKMTDDLVSRMARQLLKGATITSKSCPECGTPLLRDRNGNLYCEKCKRPVIILKKGATLPEQSKGVEKQKTVSMQEDVANIATIHRLQKVLLSKVQSMTELLAASPSLHDHRELLEDIRLVLELYLLTKQV
ncbi:MAG: Sjogren's syndrome/scleroderma autoantigen 1 family protein [Candidatus Ranarchaeia archaeon]